MKKLLFAFPIVALLAAGCNSSQQTTEQNPPAQQTQTEQTQQQTAQNPAPSPTPTPTPSQSDIAAWKTYTSVKYGYQFKYPTNWYFEVGDTDGSDPHLSNLKSVPEVGMQKGEVVVEIQGFHTKDANVDLMTYVKNTSGSSVSQVNLDGTNFVKEIMGAGPLQGNSAYDISVDSTHYVSAIVYPYPNTSISIAERIVSTIAPLTQNSVSSSTASKATVNNVFPSGSIFTQGEGANIPLSWSVTNPPAGTTIYLDLLSSDGSESLGRITNSSDCSKGGDTIALSTSVKSYKWDGLVVCQNWQAHTVNPGSYRLGVELYSADGTTVLVTGQSKTSFSIQK